MFYGIAQIFTKAFDLAVAPFGNNQAAALSALSLLTGVVMIFVFKAVSDQKKIKASRDKFKARILEMRIYQDDLLLIHKALFKALATNLEYLRVSFVPIVVLVSIVFVIFVQLDERYGRRHLQPAERAMLTVTLKEGLDPMTAPVQLVAGDGMALDSAPVRWSGRRQVSWRIRPIVPGSHQVTIKAFDKTWTLPVAAELSNKTIGHRRATGAFSPLLYPSLPKIPKDSPIQSVELHYPSTDYPLFIWRTHWLVVFVVFSFIGALIPKFVFRIEI
jgi:uncharacterized membrane protein (DUF106 family)